MNGVGKWCQIATRVIIVSESTLFSNECSSGCRARIQTFEAGVSREFSWLSNDTSFVIIRGDVLGQKCPLARV